MAVKKQRSVPIDGSYFRSLEQTVMTTSKMPKPEKKIHLCGICQYNIALCPWLHADKPVEGWTAHKTHIERNGDHKWSYHVTTCPLYVAPDPARLAQQDEEERREANARSYRTFY